MSFPIRKVQTQQEKVIDYHYIRNLKNKEVRKNRFKRTASQRFFRFCLLLVLLGELFYLGAQGLSIVRTSPLFVLKRVEVAGTKNTTVEEIQHMVLSGGHNAWSVDLTEVKLLLENHPWIQSAVLWRELPGTIRVHITEREPTALVLSGNLYLVDSSGRVIEPFQQETKYSGLPVITGINDVSNEEQIRAALTFVREAQRDTQTFRKISEIHYYDNNNTIVYLKGISFGLLVSKDGMLPMIKKCVNHIDFIKRNFADQKLVDLRYDGQIVLKNSYKQQL